MAEVTHTFEQAEAEAIVFMLHWEIQGAADAIGNQSVSDYGHKQDEMRRLQDLVALLDAFGSVAPEDAEGGTVACKEETNGLMAEGTITIETHEVEGLADELNASLSSAGEGFEHADADRRAYVAHLAELVDIEEALRQAGHEGTELPRTDTLENLIRRGAEYAPERFGDALKGRCDDQADEIHKARGMMSLGTRTGLYEGVVV